MAILEQADNIRNGKCHRDCRRYLLMLVPEPGHWTLCIADRQTKTLYRQDNLHLPYKLLIDPLLTFLSRWREEAGQKWGFTQPGNPGGQMAARREW